MNKTDDTPGPGSYNFDKKSTGGKTMAGRSTQKDTENAPGPGAYNTQPKKNKAYSYSMGVRLKESTADSAQPGPGAYEAKSSISKSGKSLASRTSIPNGKANVPGPGQYTVNGKVGTGQPSYSMGGRYKDTDNHQATPGPGNYSFSSAIGGKNVGPSMKGRYQTSNIESGPGPGAYVPNQKVHFWCLIM